MTRVCRILLMCAALGIAVPALAAPISGGFDVSGYVNDKTVTSQWGMVYFGSGDEVVSTPTDATGTFSSIAAGTPLDFTSILSVYMVYNGAEPTVFSFVFDGDTYVFQATSYEAGSTVKIAGIITDQTNPNTGYGEIDFTSPAGGEGNFTGSYVTTPTQVVYPDMAITPEPASLALLATGLSGIAAGVLRRRRAA